jgi:hypothetical protein
MRTKIIIFCGIVGTLCLLLWPHRPFNQEKPRPHEPALTTTNQAIQLLQAQTAERQPIHAPTNIPQSIPKTGMDLYNQMRSNLLSPERRLRLEQMQEDWQTPIEFYGLVVDENTNPVADAQVNFDCNDLSKSGTSYYHTQSDANGLFSIKGIKGKLLSVKVNKEGYYSYHPNGDYFYYAGENQNFVPDENNPVIFRLRKRGQGVELITSEHGMQLNVDVDVPRDNTPVRVDFFQKQASATGQLEIRQIKPPWQGATNWSFSLNIPDGGLVENQDELQFEAPETGYQSTVEYNFAKDDTNWTTQVSKQFYITFGQPRKYGWFRIESNLAQETIFLTYAINPDGSRNLEPLQ